MGHELVVLKTDQPADSFKITGFEGEPDRFNEDAKGLTNVGETGDPAMKPGASMMLTIDMAQGHYAIRVQLERPLRRGDAPGFLGHSGGIYAGDRHLGRHLIDPDVDHAVPGLRPCRQGHLLITNAGTMGHELVVLKTDQPADSFKIPGSRGSPTGSTKTPRV